MTQKEKVQEFAKKYNDELTSTDKRFKNSVHLSHGDGSVLLFKNAFCVYFLDEDGSTWVLVFTEHHGFLTYPKDELCEYGQYEPTQTTSFIHNSLI